MIRRLHITHGQLETTTDLGPLGHNVPTFIKWFVDHFNYLNIESIELVFNGKRLSAELLLGPHGWARAKQDADWLFEVEMDRDKEEAQIRAERMMP